MTVDLLVICVTYLFIVEKKGITDCRPTAALFKAFLGLVMEGPWPFDLAPVPPVLFAAGAGRVDCLLGRSSSARLRFRLAEQELVSLVAGAPPRALLPDREAC